MTRQDLETQPNFVATFQHKNGPIECLMATIHGGRYWHKPDYQGIFAWGATRSFNPDIFKLFAPDMKRISNPTWQLNKAGRYTSSTCPVCTMPLRSVLDGELWCDYCQTYY